MITNDKHIDPVCKMTVDPKKAAGTSTHNGRAYYFCNVKCKERFDAEPDKFLSMAPADTPHEHSREMSKDPVCGMVVEKSKSLNASIGGRTYYFCSDSCLRTYEAPEAELKKLKTRVSVALAGVLLLAVLRAGFFLGLATGASIVSMAPIPALPWFTWGAWLFILTTPVQVIGGWGFYRGAYNAIKGRMINMDLLIALGTSTAYLYSVIVVFAPDILPVKVEERDVYFEVSAIIIAFVLLGKYMEEIIKKRSSSAIRNLLELKPTIARVVRDNVEAEVPAEEIKTGEIIVVRSGEKVPVDGLMIEGAGSVDEKMMSGESVPVDKKAGDSVIGGTLNLAGFFKFKATRVGGDTTLSQIIRLVEEAQASTAPIQRIADRATAYFVPAVIISALLAFFGWWAMGDFPQGLLSFIAVVIVSCPCALGIATPAALMVGVGKGAEAGILIRGGEFLEQAGTLTTIVFDKTGTLTKGEPEIARVIAQKSDEAQVLFYAASVERGSEHPLAKAIIRGAKERGVEPIEPTDFKTLPGEGVSAMVQGRRVLLGNTRLMDNFKVDTSRIADDKRSLEEDGMTAMLLSIDGECAGIIAVFDTIKDGAKEAVDALKKSGLDVIMLTGDNERTARAVARKINIESVLAGVLPHEKAGVIKDLKSRGKIVAMVGDGINDSPALAEAQIGIALGSGSDIAKETGGIILVRDDVRDVVAGIKLSKATMRKIKQNLFWAFFYNSVGIPIAALGLLSPIFAAAAMALSSICVVANSASLKRLKLR